MRVGVERGVLGLGAYRRGEADPLCAHEGQAASGFWKPLIPTAGRAGQGFMGEGFGFMGFMG